MADTPRRLTPEQCESAMAEADHAGLGNVAEVIDMLAQVVSYFSAVTPARARANMIITMMAQEMRLALEAVYDTSSSTNARERIRQDFIRWDKTLREITAALNAAEEYAASVGADVTLTSTDVPVSSQLH